MKRSWVVSVCINRQDQQVIHAHNRTLFGRDTVYFFRGPEYRIHFIFSLYTLIEISTTRWLSFIKLFMLHTYFYQIFLQCLRVTDCIQQITNKKVCKHNIQFGKNANKYIKIKTANNIHSCRFKEKLDMTRNIMNSTIKPKVITKVNQVLTCCCQSIRLNYIDT